MAGRGNQRTILLTDHPGRHPGILRLGEIGGQTFVINSCDGWRRQISELPLVHPPEIAPIDVPAETQSASAAPAASGMSIDVEDRIRDLEQGLREERRALREAKDRYRTLELKYQELAQGL